MRVALHNPGEDAKPGQKVCWDEDKKIRYGVICLHEVLDRWAESSTPIFDPPSDVECPECGFKFIVPLGTEWGDVISCQDNENHTFEVEADDCGEPQMYDLNDGQYVAYSDEHLDIIIQASPYYTYCEFCSPCAPGAGFLMKPFKIPAEYKETSYTLQNISPGAYSDLYHNLAEWARFKPSFCFGHDWFSSGKAPYRVFEVGTNKEVLPE